MMKARTENSRILGMAAGILLALGATSARGQATLGATVLATSGTVALVANAVAAAVTSGTAAPATTGTVGAIPTAAATPITSSTAPQGPVPESKIEEAPPLPPPLNPGPTTEGLRFNFRGVSLDRVLDYMSVAAGFIIVRDTDVRGTVDVVSHQALNKDESVLLLNTILNQKGLAAIRNDRTLTIVSREEARTRDLPIRVGSDPTSIPKTDEMVTQIMPVRHADVNQLIQNLDPLLPEYASITANQSSNAIILTSTQTNIRTVAEIIQALDTSISGVSKIRVFTVSRADAAELATMINTLFGGQGSSGRRESDEERARRMREFFDRMRGGRGGPGGRGR